MEFRIEKRDEFAVKALEGAVPKHSRMGVMGICVNDFDEKTNTFTYLIGIERPVDAAARKALPRGCADFAVPAGTWAVFGSRGPLPGAIQDVWKRVYSEWFPASGYEHADSPDLEVYGMGDIRAADYYCEVWLPVRKA